MSGDGATKSGGKLLGRLNQVFNAVTLGLLGVFVLCAAFACLTTFAPGFPGVELAGEILPDDLANISPALTMLAGSSFLLRSAYVGFRGPSKWDQDTANVWPPGSDHAFIGLLLVITAIGGVSSGVEPFGVLYGNNPEAAL